MESKNFLIIQTSFIGDAILATSLIESLYIEKGNRQIDILVRKGNEGLFKNNPKVRNTLIWDKQNKKYSNLFKLLNTIRKNKYETVLNLQRFLATGILTAFSGATHKIGFNKNPLAFLYNKRVPHLIGDGTHEIERNFSLIKDISGTTLKEPKIYPTKEDFEMISKYQDNSYICLAPTSVWFTKQLPSEKWIELIDNTSSSTNIYLLGGKGDFDACEEIKNKCKHPSIVNLAGKLNLLQSAALMKDAEMNHVNDSAPMHLASALNANTTAYFCSTIPEFGFGPRSENSSIVQTREDLKCRPCGLHGKNKCPLGHFKCATSIQMK